MKVSILCISDTDKHFASAIAEYEKRMGKDLDIINIKPVKHGTREQIIEKETMLILEKLQHKTYIDTTIFLLSKDGKQFTTPAFVKALGKGGKITFVIGGPYGLNEDILLPYIAKKIAFGQQTMPHGLAKLVLLEQVYRVSMIQDNRSYHY